MDSPAQTLYWTLRHGQRRQLAEQFGVYTAADRQLGDIAAARAWLKRLSDCGSLGQALAKARHMHFHQLREIEETLRWRGAHALSDELEHWRDHHYRLLALAAGD